MKPEISAILHKSEGTVEGKKGRELVVEDFKRKLLKALGQRAN